MFTCFCKVRVKKELLRSEIGDYDDQYLIERYRLDRMYVIWSEPVKNLNLPANQNRKGGGRVSDFCKHKEDEGRGQPGSL